MQNQPPAASSEHADYGFDAPKVPLSIGLGGISGLIVAVVSWILGWGVLPTVWWGLVGVVNLASAALYVYATRRGSIRHGRRSSTRSHGAATRLSWIWAAAAERC